MAEKVAVADVARAAGVKVHDGHGLTGVDLVGHDAITLSVEGLGAVAARYAIGADGMWSMWSTLRKLLGQAERGYLGEWHAFRQYFTDTGQSPSELWVWFEPDLLPGYAWSFPLPDGRANVGFGIQRGGKVERVQEMKRLWPEILDRPHIRAALGPGAVAESPHKAWPIPARVDRAVLSCGRALFAGDAAAVTDPMTGEGIGQALLTGVAAAEAILRSGPYDAPGAAAGYERRVRRELVADHKMSTLLIRALKHRKGARAAVRIAGATDWTRRNFARWLFEDYPRALVVTPRRWHRGMFTGPGAYRGQTMR